MHLPWSVEELLGQVGTVVVAESHRTEVQARNHRNPWGVYLAGEKMQLPNDYSRDNSYGNMDEHGERDGPKMEVAPHFDPFFGARWVNVEYSNFGQVALVSAHGVELPA